MQKTFGFLLAAAWVPLIIEPANAPRWAVAAVFAPLVLMLCSEGIPRPLKGWGAFAIFALAVGVLWTPDRLTGYEELAHLAVLAACFCAGAVVPDLRKFWAGLAVGLAISVVIAIAQKNGWQGINQVAPPAGTFMNKNVFAEAGLVVFAGAVGFGMWWATAIGAAALVLGASKAALGAAVLVVAVYLWKRIRSISLALFWLVGTTGLFLFATGHPSAVGRVPIWAEIAAGVTWYGNGPGSLITTWPTYEHAHLEILHLAYEHGVLALPLLGVIAYLWRPLADAPDQLVITAILAVGLFAFPFRMPVTACAFALAAGLAAARRARVRRFVADAPAAFRGRHLRGAVQPS